MHSHLKIPDRVTAGQIANCVAGKNKKSTGFSGCFPQLVQSILLVSR
jgi:Na+/glutamate symporter